MAKTHHVVYAGASDGLITAKSKARISITTGKRKTIAIPNFSEGRVNRLYVKQVGGTSKAFDVELLASKKPYAVGEANYNAAVDTTDATAALFRAMPKQAQVTAGNAHDYWDDWGHPWINMDQVSHTDNQRTLYLTIIPANSSDTTTWEVTLITQSDASD